MRSSPPHWVPVRAPSSGSSAHQLCPHQLCDPGKFLTLSVPFGIHFTGLSQGIGLHKCRLAAVSWPFSREGMRPLVPDPASLLVWGWSQQRAPVCCGLTPAPATGAELQEGRMGTNVAAVGKGEAAVPGWAAGDPQGSVHSRHTCAAAPFWGFFLNRGPRAGPGVQGGSGCKCLVAPGCRVKLKGLEGRMGLEKGKGDCLASGRWL